MKNGICPQCNSIEIYRGTLSPLRAGDGMLHLEAYPPGRGVNILLDAFVCTDCGHVEMMVNKDNMVKMTAIKEDPKNWSNVPLS
jgi:predicted RNA-binding Zn-ribbon protein involved in translation (DUF1610 family)